MKRFYLLVVALVASIATLSAQESSKDWGIGLHAGINPSFVVRYTGFGEVAGKPMYLEGRLGTRNFVIPDGTAIVAWECVKFGESHVGDFSFDAGVALNAGGWSPTDFWIDAGALLRLDYTFKKAPISLSFDYTPIVGVMCGFTTCVSEKYHFYHDWERAITNVGLSFTYNF